MVDITIVFMGFINQLITGGHHPAAEYPVVMTNIAIENHHFLQVNHLFQWVIFHSHVSLPEGMSPAINKHPFSSMWFFMVYGKDIELVKSSNHKIY